MSEGDGRLWEGRFREMLGDLLSQRLDPLASDLNSFQVTFDAVRARLVEQARSSSQGEIDTIALELRQRFEESEQEFEREMHATHRDLAQARNADRATLNASIAEIDRQRTQAGVLGATISGASTFAARVALFVVRSGSVVGWRGIGFGSDSNDQTVALLSSPVAARTLLGDAVSRRQSVSVVGEPQMGYLSFLGGHLTAETRSFVAVPLVVRDKPAAVLYADTTDAGGLDVQPLEALMRVAGMAIELLPLRRSTEALTTDQWTPRILTASLEGAGTAAADALIAARQDFEPDSVAPPHLPEQPPTSETAPLRPDEPPVPSIPVPSMPVPAMPVPSVDDGLRESEIEPQPDDDGSADAPQPPAVNVAIDSAVWPADSAAVSTDARAHLNARRFARFLIGGIRLYQPSRVAEGCRRADIYDRLRDEIEMSRRLYERHVSSQITAEFDYFYHELVSSLAEGDATKLGPNFPVSQG